MRVSTEAAHDNTQRQNRRRHRREPGRRQGHRAGAGEAGATVYVSGRTEAEGQGPGGLAGTIHGTAAEVSAGGGHGIAVRCDHRDDAQTEALFAQVRREQGQLDILVNNVWGGYEYFADGTEFWKEQGFWDAPLSRWDSMFAAGVRAHYVSGALAVPLMLTQKRGLIVNTSFFAAQRDDIGVAYGVAKAADDRMAALMAHELRPHGIAAVSLCPGLVRTEGVPRAAEHFDLTNSESPQFLGRAVAALAADPNVLDKSGRWLVAAELAEEYGFTDVDGKRPTSCRAEMPGGI